MDSYAVQRKIETATKDKSVLIRFYALNNGTDIWIDGESYIYSGEDMKDFLMEECELTEDEAEALSQSWDVIGAQGFAAEFCYQESGVTKQRVMKWSLYSEIVDTLGKYPEDLIKAGLEMGIEVENIGYQYLGQYESFEKFVEQNFVETLDEDFPKEYIKYLDFEKIAKDWEVDYYYNEGYVFATNP